MTSPITAQHTETRCGRCHRILKSAESIALGYGPRCAAVEAATEGLTDKQVDKMAQLILDKAIVPANRKGVYKVVNEAGEVIHTVHAASGNCTCQWGLRRESATVKTCYHAASARLLDRPVIRHRAPAAAPAKVTVPSDAIWAELEAVGALAEIPAF